LTCVKSPRDVAVAAVWVEFDEEALERRREEQRKQGEVRQREEEMRRIEERNRGRLVESLQAWLEAKRLRWFIRACERELRREALPAGGWQEAWLAWAREHADRLDPMTSGFLAGEERRLTHPEGGRWAGGDTCPGA
jgi:hypothetical protein